MTAAFLLLDWLFSFCRVPELEPLRCPTFPTGRDADELWCLGFQLVKVLDGWWPMRFYVLPSALAIIAGVGVKCASEYSPRCSSCVLLPEPPWPALSVLRPPNGGSV